jgi:predicted transcriptional regulator
LDEIKNQSADSTPKGQNSQEGKESNSQPKPKTYTESEHKKLVEDAIAQYGDRIKKEKIDPVVMERDTFKTKVSELEPLQNKITDLETEIEALAEKNPDGAKVTAKRKELARREKELQAKELEWGEREKRVLRSEFKEQVVTVSDLYENGDPDALLEAADELNITTKDALEKLAKRIGWKVKAAEPAKSAEKETNAPDSGLGSGGNIDFSSVKFGKDAPSAIDMIKAGLKKKK